MTTNWQSAEVLALEHLRRIGFDDAELTGNGPDHGKDIVAARAIAQVKFEAGKTTEPQIRDLLGTAKREGKIPVFYSLTGYTDKAIAWAGRSVALFQYSQSGEVTAINSRAHGLAAASNNGRASSARPQAASTAGASGGGFTKFVVIAVVVIAAFIALSTWSANDDNAFKEDMSHIRGELEVSREAYEASGKVWPFKFDAGVLQCRGEAQVVTAVFDGVVYGIEGVEGYRLEGLGWYSSNAIILDDENGFPGSKLSLDDVLHEGRSACAQDTD